MATVAKAVNDFKDARHIQWGPLTSANPDGEWVSFQGTGDRTIQVNGTFGAGTFVLQGTNDLEDPPTNVFTLTDLQTLAISKTAAALEGVAENPLKVRPLMAGADGTTSITAKLVVRKS